MDKNRLIKLQKIGLIDKSQKWCETTRNDIRIIIANKEYIVLSTGQEAQYQLRRENSQLYLTYNLTNLDLIKYQKNDIFLEKSSFYLVYDDLLCSIFPVSNINLMITFDIADKLLYLKKTIVCLNKNLITVFNITFDNINYRDIPKKEIPEITNVPTNEIKNENLVPFNKISILHQDNFGWLDLVIGNNIEMVPDYLQARIKTSYKSVATNYGTSIIYLNYIINNYDTLANKICFINSLPILKFDKVANKINIGLESLISQSSTNLIDMRVNITGDRISYLEGKGWSKWYNIEKFKQSKVTQPIFLTHILKYIPSNKYLEYASSNTRMISKDQIRKYPLSFYKLLSDKYINKKTYCLDYLDRSWDSLWS